MKITILTITSEDSKQCGTTGINSEVINKNFVWELKNGWYYGSWRQKPSQTMEQIELIEWKSFKASVNKIVREWE